VTSTCGDIENYKAVFGEFLLRLDLLWVISH
jgi:hypothetical protein